MKCKKILLQRKQKKKKANFVVCQCFFFSMKDGRMRSHCWSLAAIWMLSITVTTKGQQTTPFTCAPGANATQFDACFPKPSLLGGLVFDDCGRHRSDPWAFGCECASAFSDCARMFGCVANQTAAALCVAATCTQMECGSDLISPSTSTLSSRVTTPAPNSGVSVETSAVSTTISGSIPGSGGPTVVTPSPLSLISTTTTPTMSLGSSSVGASDTAASDDLPIGLWIGLGVAAAACLIGFLIAALVWRQRRRRAHAAADGAVQLNNGTAAPGTQRAQSTVPPENSLYVPGSLSPSQVPNFTTNASAVGTRAADSTHARSTKRHRHRRRNSNSGSGSGDAKGHSDAGDDDDDNEEGGSRVSGYEAVPSLSASGRNKKRLSDGYDAVPPTVSSKSTNRSNSKRKHQQQQNGNHSEARLSSVMPQSSANGYDLIPSGANGTRSAAESGYDKLPGANRASGHTYELVPEVQTTTTTSSIGLKRGK